MNKTWTIYPTAPVDFQETTEVPGIIAQLLFNREITTYSQVAEFLNSSSNIYHDPMLLPGMAKAINRIEEALISKDPIGVFGDFDVDGVTATAIIFDGLGKLGIEIIPYIPDRITEGHGLNYDAIQSLSKSGAKLIITVDCGITSHEEVNMASKLGIDVIITDHHVPPTSLPNAMAIVDPKVSYSIYPFPELTGAGLAFKLIQGFYNHLGIPIPNTIIGLAALGTVADMAPLLGENRTIVRNGLNELQNTNSIGLQALFREAGILETPITSETISFKIAPRLNASGRLQHAISSFNLLTTSSFEEANTLAKALEDFNINRRTLTDTSYLVAQEKANSLGKDTPIILISDSSFTPGIAGLLASKLTNEFHKPAIVMSHEQNLMRASGRSIPGFNLISALDECEDLFTKYGGHPMAAGFTIDSNNVSILKKRLNTVATTMMNILPTDPILKIDITVIPSKLMGDIYNWFNYLEPFGVGNPTPVFLAKNVEILKAWSVGGNAQHTRLKINDGISTWDGIAFGQQLDSISGRYQDLVYSLLVNNWRGKKAINLKVLDLQSSRT
ncbi:single-stranded-DNA-specific exonuclease RecJ [SAR202 cluster bacterium AC-409-J13_OGT_754m]|nr:single-stranded-DNA-specific exonuclease RecJ [SAR202 cluster bacterium AC-409-J13_OGT_754m]